MPEERSLADEWLARAAGKWRLQVLQKRGRNVLSDGRWSRSELPVRVRRFLNGTPVGMVHEVLRILDTTTEIPEEALFNREPKDPVEANSYNPVRTYIVKDGSPNESNGRDPTYTIVQDLRLADDVGDGIDGILSDSACSQDTRTTYEWDSPSVPPAPAGGQGISYRVTNVVRDQETDLFSYHLQEQVAVTTHHSEVTECNKYEKVTQDTWDNLYGEPGAFESNMESRDPFVRKPVSVPEPCCAPEGTTVRIQVQKNPDCTYRVVVETREARERTRVTETRRGLRGVTESETTVATYPLPETGLKLGEQVRNELRPDGLYDVTHVTVAREPVGGIGSSCGRTVFEHQHAETRNEASRPEDEADFAGGGKTYQVQSRATEEGTWDVTRTETTEIKQFGAQKTKQKTLRGVTETTVDRNVDNNDVTVTNIGDRVSVEMTPGGKYNRTVTKVSKESVGDVGSNCETTVFEHRHVESENMSSRPEKEASSAGGGKTYQVQARATEEGTWDVTRTETTELAVTGAQRMRQKTLRGVTETTVDRNVDDGDVTVTNVGDRVQVEQTPGGKWNRTVTKVSKEPVGDIGSNCETTVFEHRHVEIENVPDRPESETSSAGDGKTYQVQSRATEEGTWDVSRTTVEETRDVTAQHVMRKTLRGVTETTVTRSTSDSSVSVSEIGDEVRVEQTPGGLWNRTETHSSHEAVGVIGKSCSSTPVVHTDVTVSNVPDGNQPEPQHQSPEVNVEKTVETRRTEEGTWDVTERSTVHQQDVITGLKAGSEAAEVEIEIGKNVVEKPTSITGTVNVETSISASKNDYGSYDYQKRTTTYKPWGERKIAESENDSQRVEFHSFQNLTEVPDMTAGRGQSISASVSRNNVGSYDGSFRVVTGKPYGEEKIASAENDSQTVEFHAFQNLDAPPPMVAGQGESITASVSRNELGLFDGNFRKVKAKDKPDEEIARIENNAETVELRQFQNLPSPPPMTAGGDQHLSASVNRNEFGLFDGSWRRTTVQTLDSDWIEWDSETKTPTQTLKYHHGIRIFRNLSTPPTPPDGAQSSISVHFNEVGNYDGSISYSKLTEWTVGSGGGGSSHSASVKRRVLRGGKAVDAWVVVDTWVDTDPPSASMIGEGQVIHWGGGLYQVAHVTVDGDIIQ